MSARPPYPMSQDRAHRMDQEMDDYRRMIKRVLDNPAGPAKQQAVLLGEIAKELHRMNALTVAQSVPS